ncbi:hypothetical protein NMS78_002875 [Vibrio cholerae]|nr:hypothetical protein [Vibrio cholerae]
MEKKDTVFYKLNEYLDVSKKTVWVGSRPLIQVASLNLEESTNCRAHAQNHGMFDLVLLIEKNIFQAYPNSWRLIVDESIRLLGKDGVLIVRTKDSIDGTLYELKSILGRNPNLNVSMIDQIQSNGETITIYSILRKYFDRYSSNSWTIGILSNGMKNENVINLANKCLLLSKSFEMEIIVAGPKIDELASIDKIKFIYENSDDLPRISDKKSEIVRNSTKSNIMLVHDRYDIADDFFHSFEDYGYDFDFITTRQKYPSGSEFPAYLRFEENKKTWQSPIKVENFDMVTPSSFLNGGLIILKQHLAIKCNFNPLLLHNEAEDVELSMSLCSLGIFPRINTISIAKTIGINETYTSTFKSSKERKIKVNHFVKRLSLKLWFKLPELLRKKVRGSAFYEAVKSFYHHR